MIDCKCIGEYDNEICSIREECKRYIKTAERKQDFLISRQLGGDCQHFVEESK